MRRGALTCSKDCYAERDRKRTNERYWKNRKPADYGRTKCPECKKTFQKKTKDNKYCSQKCYKAKIRKSREDTQYYRKRFEILERDGFTCQYCGASPRRNKSVKLHVDHRLPKKLKGSDNEDNLITACEYCNLGKAQRFYPKIFTWDYERN